MIRALSLAASVEALAATLPRTPLAVLPTPLVAAPRLAAALGTGPLLVKRDGHEQEALDFCLQEMKRTPEWLPGIPLDAEGGLSQRYAK